MRTDADVQGLREGARAVGGRKERLRGALVIAEVIASVVLLVATGLLVRTLWSIKATDPGFRAEGVLTLRTDLPSSKYAVTARRAEFYNQVIDQIRALPGVANAAYISGLPMVWGGGIWPVGINGVELERRDNNTASMRFITPGFFATLNIPVRRGRDVSDRDTMTTQFVAVVSESFVKRYWPGQDALGRQFNFARKDRTIVGVVRDIRVRGLERSSEPQVYLPYKQVDDGWFWGYTPKELVVSATTPLAQLVPAVRRIIQEADPQQPITDVRPMTDIIDLQTASRTVQVRVLADIRAHRVPAGGDRYPRRPVVRGVAAHARDRRAYRARRSAPGHSGDGDGARPAAGRRRSAARAGVRLLGRPLAADAPARRPPCRSADLRYGDRVDDAHGARRHAAANAARAEHRSHHSDTGGVKGQRFFPLAFGFFFFTRFAATRVARTSDSSYASRSQSVIGAST